MSNDPESLISRVASAQDRLRPSEQRLASLVLADAAAVVEMTMDEFAAKAKVSAPTVARFCAAVGCNGFREFKIRLTQDRGYGLPFVHPDVTYADTPSEIAVKIFDRAMAELVTVRQGVAAKGGLDAAVEILSQARRIEFYGSGNSGIVAEDIQHKFFRLGIATVAYSDPHIFCMSALTLQPGDAVVLTSNSGQSRDILEAAKDALAVGAWVVAITRPHSALAALASAVVPAEVSENSDIYSPMSSRIAHLVLGDILVVAVAQRKGETVRQRLERAKEAVRRRRMIEARNQGE